MVMGPWLKVSSDRLVKLGMEPVTPGLHGKRSIHYTTGAHIGMIGFYRKFIPHFAEVSVILTDLTKKNLPNKVGWLVEHQRAFNCLKKSLTSYPILQNQIFQKSSCCKLMHVTEELEPFFYR